MVWNLKSDKGNQAEQASDQQEEQVDKTLQNNRFRFVMPDQWQDVTVHTFMGPEEDGIRHDIFVTIDSNVNAKTVEEFAKPKIEELANTLQGYNALNSGSIILDSGLPAYEHVYRWTATENREVIQRMVYVLAGTHGYTITTTFSVKTWKMMGNELDKIVRSFTPFITDKTEVSA